jgi:hypothetical protein
MFADAGSLATRLQTTLLPLIILTAKFIIGVVGATAAGVAFMKRLIVMIVRSVTTIVTDVLSVSPAQDYIMTVTVV